MRLFSLLILGLTLGGCMSEASEVEDSEGTALTADYEAFAALAAQHGMVPRADRPLAIGIRGRDVDGNRHPTTVARVYDDTLIVLTPDKRALRLAVSTHPWETGSTSAPDVDGDRSGDVGMIRPGPYLATRRPTNRNIAGAPSYQVTVPSGDDHLPGDRNTDHDDTYSEAERAASDTRKDRLTAVLFHQAGAGAPALIGCQGLDSNGIRVLAREGGERFDYLLVDANQEEIP